MTFVRPTLNAYTYIIITKNQFYVSISFCNSNRTAYSTDDGI